MGVIRERSHDPGPSTVETFHKVDCQLYSSTQRVSTAAASRERIVDQIPRCISILIGTSGQRGSRLKQPHIPPIHPIDSYQNEGGLELSECSRYGREVPLFGQGRDVGLLDAERSYTLVLACSSAFRVRSNPTRGGGSYGDIERAAEERNILADSLTLSVWAVVLDHWLAPSSGDLSSSSKRDHHTPH